MRYVQVVLTDSQVALNYAALANSILDNDDPVEQAQLQQLADFFLLVHDNPEKFPLPLAMAKSLKKHIARQKGPAPETTKRLNRRLRTQARRMSNQKRTRKNRREAATLFNAAREAAEQALLEAKAMEAAEQSPIVLPPGTRA